MICPAPFNGVAVYKSIPLAPLAGPLASYHQRGSGRSTRTGLIPAPPGSGAPPPVTPAADGTKTPRRDHRHLVNQVTVGVLDDPRAIPRARRRPGARARQPRVTDTAHPADIRQQIAEVDHQACTIFAGAFFAGDFLATAFLTAPLPAGAAGTPAELKALDGRPLAVATGSRTRSTPAVRHPSHVRCHRKTHGSRRSVR
jgi:hypothetical protein